MSHRIRIFLLLAIATGLLMPVALAQKPPAAAPQPPPSSTPGRPATAAPAGSQPNQPGDELVMFLRGRVATHDGAPVPHDMLVERICNNRVRQQVYASLHGDFSMQLGSRTDSFPEASAEPTSPYGVTNRDSVMGIPRRELTNCELRASASGFHSNVISLLDLDTFGGSVDVGVILVQRSTKIEGATLSAIPYKAPKDARKAYEKGLEAERHGNLADARKYFETSVRIYPSSANAWFQLGTVLQKDNQSDAARKAYTQATTIDTKFLPPYLSLASMAYQTANWRDVIDFTGHILDLDPFNHAAATTYILDLDPLSYADAYFYNAVANYKLNKIEDAEKSALKAEHLDLRPHFPQVHLLLAEIFARKNNYAMAIAEIQTYLALVPHAKAADQARAQLAEWEKLNGPAPTTEKPDPR
jgi:outer membrane protein assembly factor BamD (BamD/ComL family)